jgi:ABC-2 type transport system ATP-binding protein
MTLRLEDVHHHYGKTAALRGIALHVRAGDCYGFIGHNGAGKTTAMRVALGLVRPTRGRVIVDGFDAFAHTSEARARMGGLIEQPGFHAGLDATANLELLARAAGLERAAARREAGRVLERVGLARDAARRVGGFSQGMRQRLGIAQAMLGSPRMLLLDEPTNGLDPEGIRDVRALFRELVRDDGVTMLVSSHQLHELEGLCNRVGVMRMGELVVEDTLEHLFAAAETPYRLRVRDPAAAREALARAGFTTRASDDSPADLELAPGVQGPAGALRALVAAHVDVLALAPRSPTLEEIVLSARPGAAGGGSEASPQGASIVLGAPGERLAPGRELWRAARYELRRLAHASLAAALLLPAAAAFLAQLARWRAGARERELVAAGELFGTTDVTGFEAVGVGLRAGLPLLALILAALASQSLAGELARGTLRNVLLRPFRRARLALGKALAHLALGTLAYGLLLAVALAGAAALFDFGDVVEILPNGDPYTYLAASDVWPALRAVLPACLGPVLACGALGFLVGALTRSGTLALAGALGSLAALDLARAIARPLGFEGGILTAALPSPLGDRSEIGAYLDFCRGVSNVSEAAAERPGLLAAAWLLPCLLLAAWRLSRRSVP